MFVCRSMAEILWIRHKPYPINQSIKMFVGLAYSYFSFRPFLWSILTYIQDIYLYTKWIQEIWSKWSCRCLQVISARVSENKRNTGVLPRPSFRTENAVPYLTLPLKSPWLSLLWISLYISNGTGMLSGTGKMCFPKVCLQKFYGEAKPSQIQWKTEASISWHRHST